MTVLGTWKLTIATPMGTQNPTIAFVDDGGTVKGIMTAPTGESGEAGSVEVDGDSVTWVAEVNGPMGPMKLSFAATASGDTLTGKVTTPMGAIPVTGARQP